MPSELTALSNMPITDKKFNENIKTVYFEESPIMSTYLVAVVVGVFDHIEETTADGMHNLLSLSVEVHLPQSRAGVYAII